MRLPARRPPLFLLAVAAGLLQTAASAAAAGADNIGKKIDNIAFRDSAGKRPTLQSLAGKKATVVVFLSFDCPISTGYSAILNELSRSLANRGVAFLGVCPSEDETVASVARRAREQGISFPVYHDAKRRAVSTFQALATPEVFVLDGGLVLRYRGRIDDRYAERLRPRDRVSRHDLRQALEELLAGKTVSQPVTRAVGCPLVRKKIKTTGKVTFYREVLPILQTRCQTCHRRGEIGPFALTTYRQAVNWADDIKEYVQNRKMPPWKPSAGVKLRDERSMPEREIRTLAAWVDGGTPAGDPKDAPPPRRFAEGWKLGKPDLVLTVEDDFQLGASGSDVYRCFVLPTGLDREVSIRGVEVQPGNRRVVHHAILFADRKHIGRRLQEQERQKKGLTDRGPGYTVPLSLAFLPGFLPDSGLGGWAPGLVPRYLPEGSGFRLPRGADVVLQLHYHRTGRAEKDRTRVGLYLARGGKGRRMQGVVVPAPFLYVPAGAERYRVHGSIRLRQDCRLHMIMPHMHLLGRQIKITMIPPGGPPQLLLAVKDWDFYWQETYFLEKALVVKAGTRFEVEGIYDNSSHNLLNPHNPPRRVFFGLETNNEMCLGFLGMTTDRPGPIRYDVHLSVSGMGKTVGLALPGFGL